MKNYGLTEQIYESLSIFFSWLKTWLYPAVHREKCLHFVKKLHIRIFFFFFFYLPNFFNSKFCSRIFSLDMRHFLWLILLCFDLFFRRRRRFFCKIKIHIISMLLKIWRISKQIIVVHNTVILHNIRKIVNAKSKKGKKKHAIYLVWKISQCSENIAKNRAIFN